MSQGGFVFIVNPRSANGATLRRFERVRERFQRELEPLGGFEVRLTERPRHATELARAAIEGGARAVIAVGGDGTNHEVVNGFFDDDGAPRGDAAFGVVTSGTGGDFRRTFGWTTDPLDDLARLKRFQLQAIDVGRATVTLPGGGTRSFMYVNSGSFGVSGDVVDRVNHTSKALGARVSFLAGTVTALLGFAPQKVGLAIDDGAESEAEITVVTAANGRYFGGGMKMAPDARADDGFFDCVVITGGALGLFVKNAARLYAGTHISLPQVKVHRCKKVVARPVQPGEVVRIELDGEAPGMLPATFEIRPAALKLLV
jgi:YegS/Rv2252/BmrU family lipid kinase